MKVLGLDTETRLIEPGQHAPTLACITWMADGESKPSIIHGQDPAAVRLVREWLEDDNIRITAHNTGFDAGALCNRDFDSIPLWFEKYEKGLVTCTKWRQILLDTALGCYRWTTDSQGRRQRVGYDLATCVARMSGRRMSKGGDTWRLRYGELLTVPVAEWPKDAVSYALGDAVEHLAVYHWQERTRAAIQRSFGHDPFKCEAHEVYSYFCLNLSSTWGFRTDGDKVDLLESQLCEEIERVKGVLVEAGLVRPNGTRNTKVAAERMVWACAQKGIPVPKTPSGAAALDADACEETDDPVLEVYSRFSTLGTLLSKDVKMLRAGSSLSVHTSYGFAESGRTTSSQPNIQNMSRQVE